MRFQSKILFWSLSVLLGLATIYTLNRSQERNLLEVKAECLEYYINQSAYTPQSEWGYYATNVCQESHKFILTIQNDNTSETSTQETGCLSNRVSVKINADTPRQIIAATSSLC